MLGCRCAGVPVHKAYIAHAYIEKGFTVNIQCIIQLSLIYNCLSLSLVPFIYLFYFVSVSKD